MATAAGPRIVVSSSLEARTRRAQRRPEERAWKGVKDVPDDRPLYALCAVGAVRRRLRRQPELAGKGPTAMVRMAVRYVRYALAALAAVGFGLSLN